MMDIKYKYAVSALRSTKALFLFIWESLMLQSVCQIRRKVFLTFCEAFSPDPSVLEQ